MTTPKFVHLRVHTEYSLVDGTVRVKPLMAQLAGQNMPAIALTDQGNLFAMVKFYKAALGAGIKPVIGVDAWVSDGDSQAQPWRMVLLCQNNDGYRNLCMLVSRAFRDERYHGRPLLRRAPCLAPRPERSFRGVRPPVGETRTGPSGCARRCFLGL